VLGPDYFFGETIENQSDKSAWIAKARPRAAEAVPKWLEALKEKYGEYAIVCILSPNAERNFHRYN
jgi:hypothetical protein